MNTPEKRKDWHRRRLHETATPRGRRPELLPFEGTPRAGETVLWLSVIETAYDDAFGKLNVHRTYGDREIARMWFERKNDADRKLICELAGLNEDAVREEYFNRVRQLGGVVLS